MSKRLYIYPLSRRKRNAAEAGGSPYVFYLTDALAPYYEVVNREHLTRIGILDIVRYSFRLDAILFNWIENLPDKKGGYLQTMLLFLLIFWFKLIRTRVIWVMHNKVSHEKKNQWLKKLLFRFFLTHSDLVITHSAEGLEYARNEFGVQRSQIHFIHHPFFRQPVDYTTTDKQYDLLIWGKVVPYKGIDKFLRYLHNAGLQVKYRVLIAGEVHPPDYLGEIKPYLSETITLENRFISDDSLKTYMGQSHLVLFTYNTESILSSGSLMDTLVYKVPVIGPHSGAFKDLGHEGIILTYTDFDDLIGRTDDILGGKISLDVGKIEQFVRSNTWSSFGKKISEWSRSS